MAQSRSRQSIYAVIGGLALGAAAGIPVYDYWPATPANEPVNAHRNVVVGALQTLQVEGSGPVAWVFEPEIDQYFVTENTKKCVFSFKSDGTYTVIAVVKEGSVLVAHRWSFDVQGTPVNRWYKITRVVNEPDRVVLSGVFRGVSQAVSQKIQQGIYLSPEEIMGDTAEKARHLTSWVSFSSALQPLLREHSVVTTADFARVWRDIADALAL